MENTYAKRHSLKIESRVPLKLRHSFGFEVYASHYVGIQTASELDALCASGWLNQMRYRILGGGSNIVFGGDFEGLLIGVGFLGIEEIARSASEVRIRARAGELWQNLVNTCTAQGLSGIEHLSGIPGCVGGAPIQNIGAYGATLENTFESLTATHLASGKRKSFSRTECQFGYRSSLFKTIHKQNYLIEDITLRLQRQPKGVRVSHPEIAMELEKKGIRSPSPAQVSQAVCAVRARKLPPLRADLGHAGSFFQNPIVHTANYERLANTIPHLKAFSAGNGLWKLSAAQLIEHCGLKGKRLGSVGVSNQHALVLAHYGNGNPKELLKLAKKVQKEVLQNTHVQLQWEVQLF